MRRSRFIILLTVLQAAQVSADIAGVAINANVFTHLEGYYASEDTPADDLRLGETALFINGRVGSRWSFLSEITYELPRYRDEDLRVERLRLRFDLNRDNWAILGKVHTPVNYWNDTFHHGRLFFPTINRPLTFNRFIPIHEAGLRFAGQRFAGTDFAYDIVLGTGQSEGDDLFADGVQSYTAALSWAPSNRVKLMASYYRDTIKDHVNDPLHSHGEPSPFGPWEMGGAMDDMGSMDDPADEMPGMVGGEDLEYEMYSFSAYLDTDRFEALTELSANRSDGGDFNVSVFQYVGYHLSEDVTPYIVYDRVDVDNSEIHFRRGRELRYGIGVEFAFGVSATLKLEARRRDDHSEGLDFENNEIQAQLSFGF